MTKFTEVTSRTFHEYTTVSTFILVAELSIFAIVILVACRISRINWNADTIIALASLWTKDSCAWIDRYTVSSLTDRAIGTRNCCALVNTLIPHTLFVKGALVVVGALACGITVAISASVAWSAVNEITLVLASAVGTHLARRALAIGVTVTINWDASPALTSGSRRTYHIVTRVNALSASTDLARRALIAGPACIRCYTTISNTNCAWRAFGDGAEVNTAIKVADLVVSALAI